MTGTNEAPILLNKPLPWWQVHNRVFLGIVVPILPFAFLYFCAAEAYDVTKSVQVTHLCTRRNDTLIALSKPKSIVIVGNWMSCLTRSLYTTVEPQSTVTSLRRSPTVMWPVLLVPNAHCTYTIYRFIHKAVTTSILRPPSHAPEYSFPYRVKLRNTAGVIKRLQKPPWTFDSASFIKRSQKPPWTFDSASYTAI